MAPSKPTGWWQKFTDAAPQPFASALIVALAFWGFIAWNQSHWWSVKEDYGFGWLVPAFVGFVIYDRWAKIAEATAACAAPSSPRVGGATGQLITLTAYGMLVGGSVLFFIGTFYRAGAGASYPATLAITLGAAAILLPLLFLHAPKPSRGTDVASAPTRRTEPKSLLGCKLSQDARLHLMAFFVFPIFVWLVSAPMVSIVENNLNLFLLGKVTSVVFFTFDLLGMPIEQQGNVLVLPPLADGKPNQVGVADACSGIRSLTACLFAGSFLASVFLDKLWKKVALVAASMLFAVFTNLLRGIFLTSWAYNYGHEAIEGTVHDTAGYAVLGLTVIGLLCLLPLFNLKITFSTRDEPEEPEEPLPPPAGNTA